MGRLVEREIDGELYIARFKGMAYAYALRDLLNSQHSEYRVTEMLFNDILVSPDITLDDFDSIDALEKVRSFLVSVALGNTERKVSQGKLRKQVKDEWACWRLVCNDLSPFDYNTVFHQMTPREIEKANIALDKVYKAINRKKRR